MTPLENAQPLACRCVILNGYLLLVGSIGQIARELAKESGPINGADAAYFRVIEDIFEKLRAIYSGKSEMHDALRGQPRDSYLLQLLGHHIASLETILIRPLGALPAENAAAVEGLRRIGAQVMHLCEAAVPAWREADERFAEALFVHAPVRTDSYAIVSIDMVRYSHFVLRHENGEGIDAVFRLNERIHTRIEAALRAAGGDPSAIPVYDSGDGALFFCEAGATLAVRFAQEFQLRAVAENLTERRKPDDCEHFRIGIACGPVRIRLKLTPAGSLWGFAAAGLSIINAVRLQSACRADSVLIDRATFEALPASLGAQFSVSEPVHPKDHEYREILAFCWSPA